MTDPKLGKRGPGRPRTNPIEGARRNVTMQTSMELYDKLKLAADESGLSIGRQMEMLVEQGLSTTAQDIIRAAVEGAAKAASDKLDDEYTQYFGGPHGMFWAKTSADAYIDAVSKVFQDFGITGELDVTDEVADALCIAMKEKQKDITNTWYNRIKLSQVIQIAEKLDLMGKFENALKDPEFAKEAERKFGFSRSDKTARKD